MKIFVFPLFIIVYFRIAIVHYARHAQASFDNYFLWFEAIPSSYIHKHDIYSQLFYK